MSIIRAPFSGEQVERLQRWQEFEHPFTCGNDACRKSNNEGALSPTIDGWRCANTGCNYTQDWAHDFMLTYDGPVQIVVG